MTTQTNRNRNRTPYRARARGGGQWVPAYLGMHSLYDYRSADATGLADLSGNGRAAVTVGATTASPLWLPYTVPSLHLETASAGTNSLSCTAPSGTASYSAVPRDVGAPTTGAASAGAFTFTTAGDWRSVSLLDAGAVELAKFDASLSTKTGHTDSYSVAWTVNYGTGGRQAVVQSAPAGLANGCFLVGPDDYFDMPAAAVPAHAKTDVWSIFIIGRQRATVPFGTLFADSDGTNQGLVIYTNSGASTFQTRLIDSVPANARADTAAPDYTLGTRFGVLVSSTGSAISIQSGSAAAATASTAALGTTTAPGAARIGSRVGGAGLGNFLFEGIGTLNRQLSTGEWAQLRTFYGVGL